MKWRRNPGVMSRIICLLAFGLIGLVGCMSPSGPSSGGGPAVAGSSGKAKVYVDSSPSSALIAVNGYVKGSAPLEIEVDLDELGDVSIDLEVTADFADSFAGGKALQTAKVSYRIEHGEHPPSVVRFDTEEATAH